MSTGVEETSACDVRRRVRIYRPEEWRDQVVASLGGADVPGHWSGHMPDPQVSRHTDPHPGDMYIPGRLLRMGYPDLSVLVWAQIFSQFGDSEGETTYGELAAAFYRSPVTYRHVTSIGAAMAPLLGTWIQRRRVDRSRPLYRASSYQGSEEPTGWLRREQLAELTAIEHTQEWAVTPFDLVSFARWSLECQQRGWTIESTLRLATKWLVAPSVVASSRDRLAHLGWLRVQPRQDQRDSDFLVWISEKYDPEHRVVELNNSTIDVAAESRREPVHPSTPRGHAVEVSRTVGELQEPHEGPPAQPVSHYLELAVLLGPHRSSTASPSEPTPARTAHSIDGPRPLPPRTVQDDQEGNTAQPQTLTRPSAPTLSILRPIRRRRRRRALLDLLSQFRLPTYEKLQLVPHQVYLIHFPDEACFKVGISRAGSERVDSFVRHGGIVVDRVFVDSKPMAEILEAEVLALTDGWHRLGDRLRPGGGYTEMWADDGPTVDLERIKQRAIQLLTHVGDLLDGELS